MNVVLLDEADFMGPSLVCLTGRRAEHIRTVLRAKVGDRLRVGRLGGLLGEGTVRRVDEAGVELAVVLTQQPPPPLPWPPNG